MTASTRELRAEPTTGAASAPSPLHTQLLDHYKKPRNRRSIENPSRIGAGNNPLCGDQVEIALSVVNGAIADIAFQGRGCSVCIASASMLTELMRHASIEDARRRCAEFRRWAKDDDYAWRLPSELAPLSLVRGQSARRQCMTLAWEALDHALG